MDTDRPSAVKLQPSNWRSSRKETQEAQESNLLRVFDEIETRLEMFFAVEFEPFFLLQRQGSLKNPKARSHHSVWLNHLGPRRRRAVGCRTERSHTSGCFRRSASKGKKRKSTRRSGCSLLISYAL